MKLSRWMVLAVVCMGACVASGQSLQDEQKALKDALVKQQKVMRGFSGEQEVRWQWDGNALVEQAPKFRIAAVTVVKSVKFKGDKVEIDGDLFPVKQDKNGKLMLLKPGEKLKIQVDMAGADQMTLLPKLADALFYSDLGGALDDVITTAEGLAAKPASGPVLTLLGTAPAANCDCADLKSEACVHAEKGTHPKGITPPRVLHTVEPEFSDEARGKKFSGNVQVYLVVDENGNPDNIWVSAPTGMGLDAKAAQAVSEYRFKPAACHGKPVKVDLYVDINFQIF